MEVVKDFSTLTDNAKPFDTIYLVFEKAFDSVPHLRLLNKLEAYGASDKLLLWIFLNDRPQRVIVHDENSKISKVYLRAVSSVLFSSQFY